MRPNHIFVRKKYTLANILICCDIMPSLSNKFGWGALKKPENYGFAEKTRGIVGTRWIIEEIERGGFDGKDSDCDWAIGTKRGDEGGEKQLK